MTDKRPDGLPWYGGWPTKGILRETTTAKEWRIRKRISRRWNRVFHRLGARLVNKKRTDGLNGNHY